MKAYLPENHGLPATTSSIARLLPMAGGAPSITDVQYEALEAGVGRGQSVLVCAPTSTGKTLIGWWAIASALSQGKQAVYLVSHRALAQQKFEEAQNIFMNEFLGGDRSAIICATGDGVEDGAGRKSNAPLSGRLLIATYEKFLGCLSVGGPPADLTETCFVCDELQLVGDEHRGQNVELLLTLMSRAGWSQLVALSAVLSQSDAEALANWLELTLVRNPTREKSIRVECRTGQRVYTVSYGPNRDGIVEERRQQSQTSINEMIRGLVAARDRSPVIVFCMKVDETYALAESWALLQPEVGANQEAQSEDIADGLIRLVRKRTAYHNAELTEEERRYVEENIGEGHIDVVFATSTLAAGVNFPLGSAVFASWERNVGRYRPKKPLSPAEFQNMCGRVGRMGQAADEGVVIFTAEEGQSVQNARALMDFTIQSVLGKGIKVEDFGALTLQIFAGNLCRSRGDAMSLLASTLTASREIDVNQSGIDHWEPFLNTEIDNLIAADCLIEAEGGVFVTPFGRAVARSGLKPATAKFFLSGLASRAADLSSLFLSGSPTSEDDLLFVLAHAALRCPEFNDTAGRPSRNISWKLKQDDRAVPNSFANRLSHLLFHAPWMSDAQAANGALVLTNFAGGMHRAELERTLKDVRLGTIQATAREVAWVLAGIAEIIQSITSPLIAEETRPAELRGHQEIVQQLRQLSRPVRRQSVRINAGLPTDALWMTQLNLEGRKRKLNRKQVLALREQGLVRVIDLMDGGPGNDGKRRTALGTNSLANQVRKAAGDWKKSEREHCRSMHLRRAGSLDVQQLILGAYELRGDDLEAAFERLMDGIEVKTTRLDVKDKQAYPDFLINVDGFPPVIVEIKSRKNDDDFVSLNSAMEVLGASELAGYGEAFCVTLCSPGVEPSVPASIERCKRLCVLEVADLVEAFLALKEGTLTRESFYNWLTTPGIALSEALPRG